MKKSRFEIIIGCMFSGKSEELLRRLSREPFKNNRVILFKPSIDSRYSLEDVVSHSGIRLPSTDLNSENPFIPQDVIDSYDVFGFDEIQFYSSTIVYLVKKLLGNNKKVIVSGLLADAWLKPFGFIPELMCLADSITHLNAVCNSCGSKASFTKKISGSSNIVEVGEKELYEASCRTCHTTPSVV